MLRQGDVACRSGGEEFLLVLLATATHEAVIAAERIRDAVDKLGVQYRGPAPGTAPATLITAADQALYAAKQGGRDRVELFSGQSAPVETLMAS